MLLFDVCSRPLQNRLNHYSFSLLIKKIYKSLDTSTAKLVDANSCYSPDQAIEIGKLLQDNGVTHFEEPCPYWEPEQTKKVTDALDIDVSGGEQDCDFRIWRDMIDRKIVNIFQPDVMYMGGLTRILKLANLINKAKENNIIKAIISK